jgi:hypothetical protein
MVVAIRSSVMVGVRSLEFMVMSLVLSINKYCEITIMPFLLFLGFLEIVKINISKFHVEPASAGFFSLFARWFGGGGF